MFTCLPYRARHGRADDVIYQDGASAFLSATPSAAPETTSPEAQIPNGTVTNNHGYTGNLKIVAAGHAAVPDPSRGTPRLQARWLERTADAGKHGTVGSPSPGQAPGSSVDTRRPALVSTKAGAVRGIRPGTRPRAATNAGDALRLRHLRRRPRRAAGGTTITTQYFAIPAVTNEAGPPRDGTTVLPTKPFETFVFGRQVPAAPAVT